MAKGKGIKETLEVLDLATAAISALAKAMADGKFDVRDMPVVLALIGPLNNALKGMNDVPAELKDLDQAEKETLLARLLEIFKGLPGGIRLPAA